jgi:hypothetical protein
VLGVQTRVPVDLCEIKFKCAALLVDGDVHVVRAVQDLILEGAVCILGAHIVELVDDGVDQGGFVGEDLPDEVLIWQVSLTEVQVCDVAGLGEARGQLIVVGLLRRRNDGGGDFCIGKVVVVEMQLVGDNADSAILLEFLEFCAPRVPICLVFRLSISRCRVAWGV